ncbi:GTP-binding protein Rheb-like [Porphyridium purpureum]|uniref:GTP-binding protein Rheb-like n=1 Tax=Porphyridium purpureum TaxID=35688 RepID=A0A5J4YYB2_PORPP|nr:GTP-binding protein Rheb-like [Porphyridium purpureum]|eukprot:POR3791..scf209_3
MGDSNLTRSATSQGLSEGKMRRIAVLGARGVGKTSMSTRFCENTFDDMYLPTIEDSYQATIRINNQQYICEVLDTAGQDEYSIFGTQLTIGVHGFFLVFSVRDRTSFELLKTINDKLLVTLGASSIPRVLVGNQSDSIETEREVSYAEGESYAREIGCPFVECSAMSGENVTEAFVTLIRVMDPQSFKEQNTKRKEDGGCVLC